MLRNLNTISFARAARRIGDTRKPRTKYLIASYDFFFTCCLAENIIWSSFGLHPEINWAQLCHVSCHFHQTQRYKSERRHMTEYKKSTIRAGNCSVLRIHAKEFIKISFEITSFNWANPVANKKNRRREIWIFFCHYIRARAVNLMLWN